MIRRAASAAAIAAALIATAPAAQAHAQAEDLWQPTVKCATGAFTDARVILDENGRPHTWLDGWIRPCDRPAPRDRFGVIYYTADPVSGQPVGHVVMRRLRAYDGVTIDGKVAATWFSGTVDEGMRGHGRLLALCVAYDDGGLVGCVNPNKDDITTAPPTPEMLAPARVVQVPDGAETHPNCATCL